MTLFGYIMGIIIIGLLVFLGVVLYILITMAIDAIRRAWKRRGMQQAMAAYDKMRDTLHAREQAAAVREAELIVNRVRGE